MAQSCGDIMAAEPGVGGSDVSRAPDHGLMDRGAGTRGLIASNNGEAADIITHPKLTDSGQLRSYL